MTKPRIFVGSSVENLSIAYAVQEELEFFAEVTVWSQGIFVPSQTTMTSLLAAVNTFQAAVFVFCPDDAARMRGRESSVVRDNVTLEFGLFVGAIGLSNVFFLTPRGIDMHLPTDLLGVTPLTYDPNRSDDNLRGAVGPACNKIRTLMGRQRVDNPTSPAASAPELSDDEAASVLRAWLDRTIVDLLTRPINVVDLEQELGLDHGTVERVIERAVVASKRKLAVTLNNGTRLQLVED